MYFLECIASIVKLENEAKSVTIDTVTQLQLLNLKQWAFTNETLAKMWNCSVKAVETKLKQYSITVHYDKIHAYSAKINDHAAYYYAVWENTDQPIAKPSKIGRASCRERV